MLTPILVLVLASAPVTRACEGPALVWRDHDHREVQRLPIAPECASWRCTGGDRVLVDVNGVELERSANSLACRVTRCEGPDEVQRTVGGQELRRLVAACTVARCEAGVLVRRDRQGREYGRWQSVRCAQPVPVQHPLEAWRFGLSVR